MEQWKNFKEGNWQKSINVSDFIQKTIKNMKVMNHFYLQKVLKQLKFGINVKNY